MADPDTLPLPVLAIEHDVSLAAHTTLGLGGPAAHFVEVHDTGALIQALRWADDGGHATWILGGGSNVVVSDNGFDGLVVRPRLRGIDLAKGGSVTLLRAAAGECWDDLVATATVAGLSGIECLSGIPGLVGASPIQNVGAYGQEVSNVLRSVRAYDRRSREIVELSAADCALTYRDSVFRREPERWVVLEVTFTLANDGVPEIRYAELARQLAGGPSTPAHVRDTVLRLRRSKSMVLDPDDDNRRSAGSFFTNPIVARDTATAVESKARNRGLLAQRDFPAWPMGPDKSKLAAGWLIEAAGFVKGERRGPVGLSSAHALALVHHGGGTTRELLAFAREIADRVHATFGVTLRPEPVLVGVEF
ncbi:MAG: UDP-N-acetylmuramate dehydrogenase [Nannocystaceae bacterium]|nr:UDP-N-acetylmuramate dehydrogenase [Nannocystaceae bacterium]